MYLNMSKRNTMWNEQNSIFCGAYTLLAHAQHSMLYAASISIRARRRHMSHNRKEITVSSNKKSKEAIRVHVE